MVRRVFILVAVSAAAAGLLYTATAAPRPPSPDAPESLSRPLLHRAGDGDRVAVSPQPGAWAQRVHGPVHFRFSWLACDLEGKRCSSLGGLQTQSIIPPQELRIVTLRGVVTATNRFGSTTVTTSNFYYDEAGLPIESRKDLRPFVYGPAQLRAWYGLGPDQDGAGQTIVITAFWRTRGLRTAVDRFSSHYSLPLVCGTVHAGRNCFKLRDLTFGQQPKYVVPGEDEDIEWAHAIAPKARIVVLRARSIPALLYGARHVRREVHAHVISASWGAPREPGHEQTLFRQVAAACHIDQVVCTFPSGDGRAPGDPPSNSPYALAVGGSVFQARQDGSLATEAYWRHGGFGATGDRESRPVWQMGLPACRGLKVATSNGPVLRVRSPSCDYRAVPDVTATADGVLDYEIPAHRHRDPGWFFAGGTSLSSPLWAGLIALADQELARDGQPAIGVDELHRVLYHGAVSAGLDDLGDRGWDERTGWGSPKAGIVDVLARAIERDRSSS